MTNPKKDIYDAIKAGVCFTNPFTEKLSQLNLSKNIDSITIHCDEIANKINTFSNNTGPATVPPTPPVAETSHWVLLGVDKKFMELSRIAETIMTNIAPVVAASDHNSGKTDTGGGGLELLMAAQAVDGFKKKMDDPSQYENTLFSFSLLRDAENIRLLENINDELVKANSSCASIFNVMKKDDNVVDVNATIFQVDSIISILSSASNIIVLKFKREVELNNKLQADISIMAKVTAVNNLNSTLSNAGVIKGK